MDQHGRNFGIADGLALSGFGRKIVCENLWLERERLEWTAISGQLRDSVVGVEVYEDNCGSALIATARSNFKSRPCFAKASIPNVAAFRFHVARAPQGLYQIGTG